MTGSPSGVTTRSGIALRPIFWSKAPISGECLQIAGRYNAAAAFSPSHRRLAADIDTLDRHLAEIVGTDAALAYRYRLLTSMPGIGLVLACTLIALLLEPAARAAQQVAALSASRPTLRAASSGKALHLARDRRARPARLGGLQIRRVETLDEPAVNRLRSEYARWLTSAGTLLGELRRRSSTAGLLPGNRQRPQQASLRLAAPPQRQQRRALQPKQFGFKKPLIGAFRRLNGFVQ